MGSFPLSYSLERSDALVASAHIVREGESGDVLCVLS